MAKQTHTIQYAGIEFHASSQALAISNVSQHRLNTAIDLAKQLDRLSYANIKANHEAGCLPQFLMSLSASELAIVISNTVAALQARGHDFSVMDVYTRYEKQMSAYREQQEAERMELVALEANYGDCPEAIDEMNSRWQDALASYI